MSFPFDPMLIEEAARVEQMHGRTSDALALSQAISLKRIADALSEGGSAFLAHLGGVLSDASHDHAQRMR